MRKLRLILVLSVATLVLSLFGCWRWGSQDFQFDDRVAVEVRSTPAGLVSPAPASPTPRTMPPPTVEIDPPRTGQGGTALVRIKGVELDGLVASFQGKPLPLFTTASGAAAFIGLPPDHPTGEFPVVLRGNGFQDVIAVLSVIQTQWPVENITVSNDQADLLTADAAQREGAIRGPVLQTVTEERLWQGQFQRPVTAAISDQFGIARSYNNGPIASYHSGTDFASSQGDPVFATARGKVTFAGPLPVRGGSVIIDHGHGVLSGYHHLSEVAVTAGQMVAAGDRLGRVGSTGLSTGPHLHWEIIVRGVNVDPMIWTQREFLP